MRRLRTLSLSLAVALLLVAGCRRPEPPPPPVERPPVTEPEQALRPLAPGAAPALLDDLDPASLRLAVERSLAWLGKQTPERELVFGPRRVSAARLAAALGELHTLLAAEPDPASLASWLDERFEVLVSVGDEQGQVLVTGYYEPLIKASLEPGDGYPVPIYGPPDDIIRVDLSRFSQELEGKRISGRLVGKSLEPYYTRQEIREGALSGRGLEIAWAADPVELFFLEVQGSGSLELPDGSQRRVGWAGGNGRSYRSIGRLLIDEGEIPRERMSMQALRIWLRRHPEQIERVLDYNDSRVFFRFIDTPPQGNLGQPVTPGRSVAVDQKLLPPAALGYLETHWPELGQDGSTIAGEPIGRLVLLQDTGGAIRGPDRVDLFFGRGDEAARNAGLMKLPGTLYVLAPRE